MYEYKGGYQVGNHNV